MSITHGKNGWSLADYDWDPDTGIATLVYERQREDFDAVETKVVTKEQRTWWLSLGG